MHNLALVLPMTGNVILYTAIFETVVLTVSPFAHEQMASCNLGLSPLSQGLASGGPKFYQKLDERGSWRAERCSVPLTAPPGWGHG